MQQANNIIKMWAQMYEPYFNNPVTDWYMDQYTSAWLKMYYWPFFIAGNGDNIKDIMKMPFRPMCFM